MKYLFIMLLPLLLFIGCSKHEEGVVTLKDGLKYKDDVVGTGKAATMGELVSVHFQGWIVKDSSDLFSDWTKNPDMKKLSIGDSRLHNRPIKYVLGKRSFINGVDEGIVGMKEGGTRTMIIPADLAYGKRGIGPIPPNSKLKITIELLSVKDQIKVTPWQVDSTKYEKTKNGLKYYILEQGTGNKIKPGDTVTVHYSGFLLNGREFDSSVERDQPFTFVAGKGQVIPGWDEGIQLLKKGGKAKFIIPPGLAYGSRNMGTIPPNSTLVFDVQVLDVK